MSDEDKKGVGKPAGAEHAADGLSGHDTEHWRQRSAHCGGRWCWRRYSGKCQRSARTLHRDAWYACGGGKPRGSVVLGFPATVPARIHRSHPAASDSAIQLLRPGRMWPHHEQHDDRTPAGAIRGNAQRQQFRQGPDGGSRLYPDSAGDFQQAGYRRVAGRSRRTFSLGGCDGRQFPVQRRSHGSDHDRQPFRGPARGG